MQLEEILRDLCRELAPRAGPEGPQVVHTHASAVVLAGEEVFKLKKAVDLGFLDYSTLARRKAMCEAEVEKNRRLAPGVYLGVVPIVLCAGRATLGGEGEAIEHAVHMRRLPEQATLAARVEAGPIEAGILRRVGERLARFHAQAPRGPEIARWARFEPVRENCRDNLAALSAQAGVVAPAAELLRLELLTEAELERQREQIERRAASGVPCETHGDLRLEHVYLLPEGELAIIDCIEFSPRFACADPVADVAFLAMDLAAHGAWREARVLVGAWLEASGDGEARALLPLYRSYRSAVRAKVRALQAAAEGIPPAQRERALELARAHVQIAVGELSPPDERPCLLLVGGLPGTGKSVLSGGLARAAGFEWLRTDVLRKELAGLDPLRSARSAPESGLYTPEHSDRTYGAAKDRARELLLSGRRVLVDASFGEERRRLAFLDTARDCGVPALFFCCETSEAVALERLLGRRGDPSDADATIYRHARQRCEDPGPRVAAALVRIDSSASPEETLRQALEALAAQDLALPP